MLSGDSYRSVHPWVVGALVLIRAINREGHGVSGGLIHVPRVEAACPRGDAGGGYSVRNRIVVSPSYLTAFRDGYIDGGIVEALRATHTIRERDTHSTTRVSATSRA